MAEAFAKVNRELRVGARRPDGFHEIRSRFCTVDFSDSIEVEDAPGLELKCSGIPVPAGDSNLVARAARALAGHIGREPRARIRLEKRIPTGAGLGGGSSDAAVALLLLSRLWESRVAREDLVEVAASVGSDVPFFLFGGEADVTGRGDRIRPLEDSPEIEIILLIPPFSIETASVYSSFAGSRTGPARLPGRLEIETSKHFLGPNDLASAVLAMNQEMEDYLDSARPVALEVGITGSGSALVLAGVSAGAEASLARRHPNATIRRVRTLGRKEYERRTSL
jgi:4-diphosphocytidyl-2-C-methyl-D-erythritol kinase